MCSTAKIVPTCTLTWIEPSEQMIGIWGNRWEQTMINQSGKTLRSHRIGEGRKPHLICFITCSIVSLSQTSAHPHRLLGGIHLLGIVSVSIRVKQGGSVCRTFSPNILDVVNSNSGHIKNFDVLDTCYERKTTILTLMETLLTVAAANSLLLKKTQVLLPLALPLCTARHMPITPSLFYRLL